MCLFLRFRQRAVLVMLNRQLSLIGKNIVSRPALKQMTSTKETSNEFEPVEEGPLSIERIGRRTKFT